MRVWHVVLISALVSLVMFGGLLLLIYNFAFSYLAKG